MMLLDSHVLIWLLEDSTRLGSQARQALVGTGAVVSSVSVWELEVKADLGKLMLPPDLLGLIERSGLELLPLSGAHASAYSSSQGLPHRDPFDRMLLAQAHVEGLPLLTADAAILDHALTPDVRRIDARR